MASINSTRNALNGCLDAIRDGGHLSDNEAKIGYWMFKEFLDFCQDNLIIDGYDEEQIDAIFFKGDKGGDNDG